MLERRSIRLLRSLVGILAGLGLAGALVFALEPQTARSMTHALLDGVAQLAHSGQESVAPAPPSQSGIPGTATATWTPTAPPAAPNPKPAAPSPNPGAAAPAGHSYRELADRLRHANKDGFVTESVDRSADHVTVTQTFRFQGRRVRVGFRVSRGDLGWATGREFRGIVLPAESRADFSSRLWREALGDAHQSGLYDSLAASLRGVRDRLRLGADEYAELIAAYGQSMPYDVAAFRDGEQTKYPVVTAVDGTGVCADKSLLIAGLLEHEGYWVVLLDFKAEQHMAVGIRVPGSGYRGTGYAFVETTRPSLVGEVGDGYGPSGSVKLTSTPHVTGLGGTGASYRSYGQTSFIVERVRAFERGYNEYRARLDGLRDSPIRYNTVVEKLNRCADAINTANRHADDREALYRWLRRQAAP